MSTSRRILVTGATGKQGGAVLRSLLQTQPNPPFSILALTRNAESASAKRLATQSNVSVVQGDFSDCSAIFKRIGAPVWGVFSVQLPFAKEEAQGKALVDAAVEAGVQHFVYASVERRDNSQATEVPHFASKHRIEQHLMAKAKESRQGMTWTILRSVAFMDNYMNNFLGKGFAAMWKQVGDKKLQIVASEDIGFWGASAFTQPEEYRNKEISIAGDELNYVEASRIFHEVTGRPMPITFSLVATGIKWGMKDMGMMFEWFERVGCAVDIKALRKKQPELKDWATWLRESSQFKGEAKA